MDRIDFGLDIERLYDRLIKSGHQLPDGIHADVNGLIAVTEKLVNVADDSTVDRVSSIIYRVLDGLTVDCLKNGYSEAVSRNDQYLAQVCRNRLMHVTQDADCSLSNPVRGGISTNVSFANPGKKRFRFVESLMNRSVLKPVEETGRCNDTEARSNVWPVTERLYESLNKNTSQTTVSSQRNDNLISFEKNNVTSTAPKVAELNLKKVALNSSIKSSTNYANGKSSVSENPSRQHPGIIDKISRGERLNQESTSFKINSVNHTKRSDIESLNQKSRVCNQSKPNLKMNGDANKSKSKLQTSNSVKTTSKSRKLTDHSSERLSKVSRLSKTRNDDSLKNDKKSCKTTKQNTKCNDSTSNKLVAGNNSKNTSTPVRRISKISKHILDTLEINKKRKFSALKQNSKADLSVSSAGKRQKVDKTPVVTTDEDGSKRVKLKGSAVERRVNAHRYNSIDYSNNVSTDASAYTHISTPTSTFSCRGGKKVRVFYRRNLFSTPRRRK